MRSENTNNKLKKETGEWLKALVIALVLVVVIRVFIFAPVLVEGPSMLPTLHNGDRLIVNKLKYHIWKPERFDVIVFHATSKRDYVKRIIGMPGDTIEYVDDKLIINGKEYDEPYLDEYKNQLVSGNLTDSFKLSEKIGADVIPEGQYFVMGDNRRQSEDSRQIGTISGDKIVGKASVIYWPFKDFRLNVDNH